MGLKKVGQQGKKGPNGETKDEVSSCLAWEEGSKFPYPFRETLKGKKYRGEEQSGKKRVFF